MLDTLGVEDYGIYNVVGGIVTFFNIISSSLSGAISRFITIALGEGDRERLRRIFSTSVSIQIGMAIIVFIVRDCGSLVLEYSNEHRRRSSGCS